MSDDTPTYTAHLDFFSQGMKTTPRARRMTPLNSNLSRLHKPITRITAHMPVCTRSGACRPHAPPSDRIIIIVLRVRRQPHRGPRDDCRSCGTPTVRRDVGEVGSTYASTRRWLPRVDAVLRYHTLSGPGEGSTSALLRLPFSLLIEPSAFPSRFRNRHRKASSEPLETLGAREVPLQDARRA
jgi:hypothetical protein